MIKVNYVHDRRHSAASLKENRGSLIRILLIVVILTVCVIISLKMFALFMSAARSLFDSFALLITVFTVYIGAMVIWITVFTAKWWAVLFTLIFREEKMNVSYELYDDRVVNVIVSEKEKRTMTYSYDYIVKAAERDGYFTVNSKDNCLSFAYSDITEGDPMMLRNLLCQKLGDRFRVK